MREVKRIIKKIKTAAASPDGIVVIGEDYSVVVFNEAASRITGFTQRDVLNKKANILFHNCPDGNFYMKSSFTNRTSFTNLSLKLETKESNYKSVVTSFTPIIDDDKVSSVVFVFRDICEMIKMSESLEKRTEALFEQKNNLDVIFNSSIEGTFTINGEWEITSFNSSAQRITGYSLEDAMGQKCWSIFASGKCQNGCHMEVTMSRGKGTVGNELEIVRKDGKRIPIRINSAALLDNRKRNIGAVETFLDVSEIKYLENHLSDKYNFNNIIGNSSNLRQALSLLESVSQIDSTVVITGESGTGKELTARAIHLNSSRKLKPFVAVNCSAFVGNLIESELFGHEAGSFTGAIKSKPGKFEIAEGGTLFLDEIGNLSPAVQAKLLRIIESREFERVGSNKQLTLGARIITATNKNLPDEIAAGRFREDLYYRLNVVNIHLPPLRDRMDDLPSLTSHFIEKFNTLFKKKIKQFSSRAYEILQEYDWPGNIRELENVIEHSFVLCTGEIIQIEHLPLRIRESQNDIQTITLKPEMNSFEDAEKEILIQILRKNSGSRLKTARELGINTSTLWRKMKKYDIT